MNAYKHSKQQAAEAEIEVRENSVDIAVIDEGIGFDSNAERSLSGRRFGLAQLKERVRAAGGTFALESVVGRGVPRDGAAAEMTWARVSPCPSLRIDQTLSLRRVPSTNIPPISSVRPLAADAVSISGACLTTKNSWLALSGFGVKTLTLPAT